MLGKLNQLKWTAGGGGNRDFAFIIIFLAFGIILVAKLAPYYHTDSQSVVYNKIQTTPSVPKSFMEKMGVFSTASQKGGGGSRTAVGGSGGRDTGKHPSVYERPLFDGQTIILRVRSLNKYSSIESGQPIEAQVIGATKNENDVDLSPAINGKVIGTGSANLSAKRLNINFTELVSPEGRSYAIQGQAIGSENLTQGIDGDYSSGLSSRLLGIVIDRSITAADQVATAHLFSSVGPNGAGAMGFQTAVMSTNQEASQNISGEATKELRETPARIELESGTTFLIRVRAAQTGVH